MSSAEKAVVRAVFAAIKGHLLSGWPGYKRVDKNLSLEGLGSEEPVPDWELVTEEETVVVNGREFRITATETSP